jgi:PAS domain S-box-containing protein
LIVNESIHILYIDDSPLDRELVRDALEKEHGGFRLTEAASAADFETRLAQGDYDLVLSDFNILGFEGLQVIDAVRAKDPATPVVIVTGTGSEEIAIEAMKRGAADYVIKTPHHIQRLPHTIQVVLEKKRLQEERERAEQALRDAEAKYRSLVEQTPGVIYTAVLDEFGSSLYVSPQIEEVLGISADEWTADPKLWFKQLHPADREQVLAHHAHCCATGEPFRHEYRLLARNGQVVWVRDEGVIQSRGPDQPPLLQGVWLDITERKQAEERLAYQAFLLANVNDAIIASDTQFILTAWNPAAEQMYGWKAEEVLGRPGAEVLRSEYPVMGRTEMFQILAKTGQFQGEIIQYRKDGAAFPVEVRTIALKDAVGNTTGYISVNRDITKRKQAEAALRHNEQKFSILFQKATFAASLVRLPDGVTVDVNEAWLKMSGYTRSEMVGKTTLELNIYLNPEERARSMAVFNEQGWVRDQELALRMKSGEVRILSVNSDLVDIGGQKYVLNMAQDITERKQAEEALRQTRTRLETLTRQLLEAQEMERRHLARELHDEIGQSLSMVKIDLHRLQQLPQAADLAMPLNESVEMVERALQQVRALSVDLRPSLLDDLGLIPALRWYVDRQAQRGGLAARFVAGSLPGRLSPELETVCFRLVQEALTNVLRYAQAHQVEVELKPGQAELELAVRDDGAGFDLPAALARAAQGGSLGLLSMQERVALVGGRLEIESAPGRGTEIRANLPLKYTAEVEE